MPKQPHPQTDPPTVTTADLDAREAELSGRAADLQERGARLTLDAFAAGDDDARASLTAVEADLIDVQRDLARIGRARQELARREQQGLAEAAREARVAAHAEVVRLDVEREDAAREIDDAIGAFVAAANRHARVVAGQRAQMAAAGSGQSAADVDGPWRRLIEAAICDAIRRTGDDAAWRYWTDGDAVPYHDQTAPFSDLDWGATKLLAPLPGGEQGSEPQDIAA